MSSLLYRRKLTFTVFIWASVEYLLQTMQALGALSKTDKRELFLTPLGREPIYHQNITAV
ncbi:hypothetical protein J2S17_000906 [Cytobacillus purgationiresistens]|uniref:Uncharacterized protein n=1 Tax=Cytobacillus purgationiresistens TaxID=863449 RepID=A0ABU0ACQ3_9BACI|nr:hypothetical protein [Cytobacillus purgationiresistens]